MRCCARRNGVGCLLAESCQLVTVRTMLPDTMRSVTSTFHAPSRVARRRCVDAHSSQGSAVSHAAPAAAAGVASSEAGVASETDDDFGKANPSRFYMRGTRTPTHYWGAGGSGATAELPREHKCTIGVRAACARACGSVGAGGNLDIGAIRHQSGPLEYLP